MRLQLRDTSYDQYRQLSRSCRSRSLLRARRKQRISSKISNETAMRTPATMAISAHGEVSSLSPSKSCPAPGNQLAHAAEPFGYSS